MADLEIDLVTRSKNEEYWLRYFVESIAKQHSVTINAYGVENESSDRSIEVFETLQRAENVKTCEVLRLKDYAPGLSLNMGAKAGTAKYVVNLSSHCVPKSDTYFVELVEALESEGESCAGVFGAQLPLKCTGAQNTIDLMLTYPREPRLFRRTPLFNNANAVIRREILEQFPFDEEVTNLEDVIWAKTILESGLILKYTPTAAVYHHHGPHQHEQASGRAERSLQVLLEKEWIEIDEPDFLMAKHRRVLVMSSISDFKKIEFSELDCYVLQNGVLERLENQEETIIPIEFDYVILIKNLNEPDLLDFIEESISWAAEASLLFENGKVTHQTSGTRVLGSAENISMSDQLCALSLSARVARAFVTEGRKWKK